MTARVHHGIVEPTAKPVTLVLARTSDLHRVVDCSAGVALYLRSGEVIVLDRGAAKLAFDVARKADPHPVQDAREVRG